MKLRRSIEFRIFAGLAFIFLTVLCCRASEPSAVEVGRKIYREGLLTSGEPVKAIVERDMEIEGTQFTCSDCHRRSGFGGTEGRKPTPPITGHYLFSEKKTDKRRSAYSEETLIRLIREGIFPNGEKADDLMPRYRMPEEAFQALTQYLKTLSSDISPGVEDESIHFAWIRDSSVDSATVESIRMILERYFERKNGETRKEPRRREAAGRSEKDWHSKMYLPYRKWILHEWVLNGPLSTWSEQLKSAYALQPVFALVNGTVAGEWTPIARFCEANEIPCILPNADLPPFDSDAGYYTLYYSLGMRLEVNAILDHAIGTCKVKQIIVVDQEDTAMPGVQLLREAAIARDIKIDVQSRTLSQLPDDIQSADAPAILNEPSNADPAIVLWLSFTDLAQINEALLDRIKHHPVYMSSTRCGSDLSQIPDRFRFAVYVVHPYSFPKDIAEKGRRLTEWLKREKLPLTNHRLQEQAYYACLMLAEGMMHIGVNFYRDYLMDAIDHNDNAAAFLSVYPSPSFGPSQRFISKGAFIIPPGPLNKWPDNSKSKWIIPD